MLANDVYNSRPNSMNNGQEGSKEGRREGVTTWLKYVEVYRHPHLAGEEQKSPMQEFGLRTNGLKP